MIRSFADVIALWTGPKELAKVLRVPYPTAAAMCQRGWISSGHWARIIKVANARGIRLTADMLVKFAAEREAAQPQERPSTRRGSAAKPPKPDPHSPSARA